MCMPTPHPFSAPKKICDLRSRWLRQSLMDLQPCISLQNICQLKLSRDNVSLRTDRVFDLQAIQLGLSKSAPDFRPVELVGIIQPTVNRHNVLHKNVDCHCMLAIFLYENRLSVPSCTDHDQWWTSQSCQHCSSPACWYYTSRCEYPSKREGSASSHCHWKVKVWW